MTALETFLFSNNEEITPEIQKKALNALENGQVVYLPNYSFLLKEAEQGFLAPGAFHLKSKNISYDRKTGSLKGLAKEQKEMPGLKEMVHRYAVKSRELLECLFPYYIPTVVQGRTSFRPAEVAGRISSYRKDDSRLHVDSFPSTPVKNKRILRIFTNVNPYQKPRVWKVGEPFATVIDKIAPRIKFPLPGSAWLLKMFKITKDYRSLYDHIMLGLHDGMKKDLEYQKTASQEEVRFPPGSTWIVYTDQVSHAALEGQFAFEGTFYIPVEGLLSPATSPLQMLEKHFGKQLV